jgi:regulator of replication initiation timing
LGSYKIRFNIELIDCENNKEVIHVTDTDVVPVKDEANIDVIEKKYLNLSKETLRKIISEHLELISKKKQKKNSTK